MPFAQDRRSVFHHRPGSRTGSAARAVLVLAAHLVVVVTSRTPLPAQATSAEYARAKSVDERTRNKVFGDRVVPHWLPGNSQFWYQVSRGPQQHSFVFVDAERNIHQPACEHPLLAEALSKAAKRDVSADALPLTDLEFSAAGQLTGFIAWGHRWTLEPNSYAVARTEAAEGRDDSLPALQEPRKSQGQGEETWVQFVNHASSDVRLFWVDSEGTRKLYATIARGETHRQHTFAGHAWVAVNDKGRVYFQAAAAESRAVIEDRLLRKRDRQPQESNRDGARSPNGRFLATIREHNVVIEDQEQQETYALSEDGSADDAYQGRFHWSPDSTKLVVMQVKPGEVRTVHLIESAPDDQLQPKMHAFEYTKPGDRIDHPRPRLFDVPGRRSLPVSDDLLPNPWSLGDLQWNADSSSFDFLYNQRGHQVLRVIRVDAASGQARAVVNESSPTFIDYANKRFLHRVAKSDEMIWMSERDGWNHLYLVDGAAGDVVNQITQGPWVVRGVERVDEPKRQIWFRAAGVYPGQDPYYVHLCRINFDGTGLTHLTAGDGTHQWQFSPDGRFLLDTWSRVDQPPVTELRSASDGRLLCELERADWSALLESGWQPPERFVAKGRDGETDIHGVIFRPTHLDPNRKYPVLEQIYAGPHGAFVPKSFGRHLGQRTMAELGFIVVQIDGMGTSHRSKAFHDVCWKNLADSGFPDRIAWLRAAAATRPEMDLERVGIYGGSAGGQSALRALLGHGEFYKVAVADCGCHDNRMDKIWWNELWMGWPIGKHYAEQSNVTQAHRLTGKLLLVVGELDRNVDPASTLQVVDALVNADKDFDLLVMPGVGHGAAETRYARRRRRDFFVRHLLGVEPRSVPGSF